MPVARPVAPVVRDRLSANISTHTPVARPGEQAGSGDPALQRLDAHYFQFPVSFYLDLQLTLD